jgi:hypothetical protein
MSPARVPHPRRKQPQEYILRVLHTSPEVAPEDALAVGYYYGGRSSDGELIWVPKGCNLWSALRMRGAGLSSAVRSLNRLGYIVERIPA